MIRNSVVDPAAPRSEPCSATGVVSPEKVEVSKNGLQKVVCQKHLSLLFIKDEIYRGVDPVVSSSRLEQGRIRKPTWEKAGHVGLKWMRSTTGLTPRF